MSAMAVIRFSKFDVLLADALREFHQVAEADIREAHHEPAARPRLSGTPQYLYDALAHSLDEDQKAYDAELEAQWRQESGEDPATES
jgi:dihydrodipicolinate reductase